MKLWIALATYALIAAIGTFWLAGDLRIAIWILMAGLAAKTLVATKIG
jgi:hypothetical protein